MKKYIIAELIGDEIYYYLDLNYGGYDFFEEVESAQQFNSIEEAEEVQAKLPEGIYKIEPIYVNEE